MATSSKYSLVSPASLSSTEDIVAAVQEYYEARIDTEEFKTQQKEKEQMREEEEIKERYQMYISFSSLSEEKLLTPLKYLCAHELSDYKRDGPIETEMTKNLPRWKLYGKMYTEREYNHLMKEMRKEMGLSSFQVEYMSCGHRFHVKSSSALERQGIATVGWDSDRIVKVEKGCILCAKTFAQDLELRERLLYLCYFLGITFPKIVKTLPKNMSCFGEFLDYSMVTPILFCDLRVQLTRTFYRFLHFEKTPLSYLEYKGLRKKTLSRDEICDGRNCDERFIFWPNFEKESFRVFVVGKNGEKAIYLKH
jgi:uncharacterized protein YfbU (UPF0304 family)